MESSNTPPPAPAKPVETSTEDKTVAIVSYLTLIGFVIAIIIHGSKKTRLGAFHLRQTLGLLVTGIVYGIGSIVIGLLAVVPVIGLVIIALYSLAGLGFLVLWIMGLIAAASGQLKPIPLTDKVVQKFFPKAFD